MIEYLKLMAALTVCLGVTSFINVIYLTAVIYKYLKSTWPRIQY